MLHDSEEIQAQKAEKYAALCQKRFFLGLSSSIAILTFKYLDVGYRIRVFICLKHVSSTRQNNTL